MTDYIRKTDGWRVTKTDDDGTNVKLHQAGGGFVYSIPCAQFNAGFELAPDPTWRRGIVTAEFMEGVELPCWSDGSLWNGWAMPAFTKENVDKLVATGMNIAWDGNNVVAKMGDDPEDIEVYEPRVIEGETVWPVGAGSWTWDSVEFGPRLQVFEVTCAGFDASTDETDDRILWVKAPSLSSFLLIFQGLIYEVAPIEVDADDPAIDFTLPVDAAALVARVRSFMPGA